MPPLNHTSEQWITRKGILTEEKGIFEFALESRLFEICKAEEVPNVYLDLWIFLHFSHRVPFACSLRFSVRLALLPHLLCISDFSFCLPPPSLFDSPLRRLSKTLKGIAWTFKLILIYRHILIPMLSGLITNAAKGTRADHYDRFHWMYTYCGKLRTRACRAIASLFNEPIPIYRIDEDKFINIFF